jgi:hypothetical protein
MTTDDLRYPVGRFSFSGADEKSRAGWIEEISALPVNLRAAVSGMSDAQLDTPYRPDGWTVRQVVHHVPDSHINAFIRFKFALTTDVPRIMAYDEARWAELADGRGGPVDPSLALLDGLHARWTRLLRSLRAADFDRELEHPEHGRLTLSRMLALYAWHCRHHVAHITALARRERW